MANKRVKSKVEQQYDKELNRIKRAKRDLEKRGYTVSENVIPKRPQKITAGSVRRLEKISKDYLYSHSVAISSETGLTVSGTVRRTEELKSARNKSSRKVKTSPKTPKVNGLALVTQYQYIPPTSEEFLELRRKLDIEEIEQLKTDPVAQQIFNEGEIVFQQLLAEIETVRASEHHIWAEKLYDRLMDEISAYGKRKVMMSIGRQSSGIIEQARYIIHYLEQSDNMQGRLDTFMSLITGEMPTTEELKEREAYTEQGSYVD